MSHLLRCESISKLPGGMALFMGLYVSYKSWTVFFPRTTKQKNSTYGSYYHQTGNLISQQAIMTMSGLYHGQQRGLFFFRFILEIYILYWLVWAHISLPNNNLIPYNYQFASRLRCSILIYGWFRLPKGRGGAILKLHPLFRLILKLKNESVSSPPCSLPPGQFWKEDLAPLYDFRYDFTRCTVQFITFRAIKLQNMALFKMRF